MSVNRVYLPADVFMVCLNHALSTEKEEVMGLLIGEVDESHISYIAAVMILRRSDKRKDRVEISPEQLSDASTRAEISFACLARQLGRPLRVVGWYHSHPHITIWPSHVDLQTQAMYQMLDDDFVGIIISAFNDSKFTKHSKIQLTCFQSIDSSPEGEPPQCTRLDVPIHITPTDHISKQNLEVLAEFPEILCQEERDAYSATLHVPDLDVLTRLHNISVYTKNLCHITEVVSIPLLQAMENTLRHNNELIQQLQIEKVKLLQEVVHCGHAQIDSQASLS